MRWSMWPVSIVVHIVLVTAALIVPLAADSDPPTPAPLRGLMLAAIETVRVPPDVIETVPPLNSTRALPSVVAPDVILPEPVDPPPAAGPPASDVRDGLGTLDIGAFGATGVAVVPPLPPAAAQEAAPPKIVRVGAGIGG